MTQVLGSRLTRSKQRAFLGREGTGGFANSEGHVGSRDRPGVGCISVSGFALECVPCSGRVRRDLDPRRALRPAHLPSPGRDVFRPLFVSCRRHLARRRRKEEGLTAHADTNERSADPAARANAAQRPSLSAASPGGVAHLICSAATFVAHHCLTGDNSTRSRDKNESTDSRTSTWRSSHDVRRLRVATARRSVRPRAGASATACRKRSDEELRLHD